MSQKNIDFYIGTTANFKTATALTTFGWSEMPERKYTEKLYIILNSQKVINSYFKKKRNKYKHFNNQYNILFILYYLL